MKKNCCRTAEPQTACINNGIDVVMISLSGRMMIMVILTSYTMKIEAVGSAETFEIFTRLNTAVLQHTAIYDVTALTL
jgi:hypothetical protein